ncbi:MAG: hypothetical protein V1672_02960 [Candidatus Diapherotrites archaeon]
MNSIAKVMFTTFLMILLINSVSTQEELQKCSNFVFLVLPDTDFEDSKNIGVLELKVEAIGEDWFTPVTLNNHVIGQFYERDFVCDNGICVKHLYISDFQEFLEENNKLEICNYGNVLIHNESNFGFYETAYLPKEKFIKEVEKTELMLGEELNITITAENSGSKDAEIQIKHIRPVVEEQIGVTSFNVLKGESDWEGVLAAGESITLEYTIKPTIAAHFTLPSAVVHFENEFGGRVEILSNYPEITVKSSENPIDAYIFKESAIKKVGDYAKIRAIVKNSGSEAISDVKLILKVPSALGLIGEETTEIGVLRPNEVVYFDYQVFSDVAGNFDLACQIESNNGAFDCEGTKLTFEVAKIELEVIAGFVLILAAVGIYAYIFFMN